MVDTDYFRCPCCKAACARDSTHMWGNKPCIICGYFLDMDKLILYEKLDRLFAILEKVTQ